MGQSMKDSTLMTKEMEKVEWCFWRGYHMRVNGRMVIQVASGFLPILMVKFTLENSFVGLGMDKENVFIQTKVRTKDNGLQTFFMAKELKFMSMATSMKVNGKIINEMAQANTLSVQEKFKMEIGKKINLPSD